MIYLNGQLSHTNCHHRVKILSTNTCTAGRLLVARVRSSNPKSPKNQTKTFLSLLVHPLLLLDFATHQPDRAIISKLLSFLKSFSSYLSSLSREKNWNTFIFFGAEIERFFFLYLCLCLICRREGEDVSLHLCLTLSL